MRENMDQKNSEYRHFTQWSGLTFFYQNMNCLVILTQSQPLITGEAFQDRVLLDYAHIQDRFLLDYADILRCRVTKVNVLDQKELSRKAPKGL